jgi:type I restriction enzyme S subunit
LPKLVVPSIAEQQQIVQFLDEKTEMIDKLVLIKERKIELLKEQRASLINQVITKGLDPNAKMKVSGVEWIGEIPKHWDLVHLRHFYKKIGSGVTPRGGSETYVEEGVIFVRSQNVYFDGLRLDEVVRISENVHNDMSSSKVKLYDVLLNITGGSIGRCCVVELNEEINVNQHVCIIRPKETLNPYFLNYFLQSSAGQIFIEYFISGGNREGLNIESIKCFQIPYPSIKEQRQIVDHLNQLTKKIADLILMEQKKIDLLREYRVSLISATITGKIDVRTCLN